MSIGPISRHDAWKLGCPPEAPPTCGVCPLFDDCTAVDPGDPECQREHDKGEAKRAAREEEEDHA